MKRKISKLLSLLLAAVLLLSLAAPAALAAGSADVAYLRTAEDLAELSKNCTLDSWSQGKTVYLEADIDLTGTDFAPIPTFGGTFEGQGHTISGLSLTGSGNVRGLFRYIQPSGAVRDLSVEGWIDPTDRKNTLGGIAGSNQGLLSNCSFHGTVRGADYIGGLVGTNESTGQIINCTFSGAVTGEHYVGGIAGQNGGSIIRCANSGSINTTEVDAELDLDNLNQEQLNAAENVPVCTDIGGITGFSSGILQSCVNTGAVGYAHVGYNIGGTAGRQSGYLNGCANSGTILGRKDVGGIAGQLVPEVRLLYNEGQVGDLLDELDVLRSLIDQTGDDVRGASDEISERMQAISDRAAEAQEAIGDFADSAADWANENMDEINDLSARLSWLIDQLTPVLDDTSGLMDLAEDLADQLEEVLDEAGQASDLGEQTERELRAAVRSLRQAAASGKTAVARLLSALEHLGAALGSALQSQEAMEEVRAAAGELAAALRDMSDALARIAQLLWSGGDEAALREAIQALADTLDRAGAALEQAVAAVAAHLDGDALDSAGEDAAAAWQALRTAAQSLLDAAGHTADAASLLPELLAQGGDIAVRSGPPAGRWKSWRPVPPASARTWPISSGSWRRNPPSPSVPSTARSGSRGTLWETFSPACWMTETPCGRPCPAARTSCWTIWTPSMNSSASSQTCCGTCWRAAKSRRTGSRMCRMKPLRPRIRGICPMPGMTERWRAISMWPGSWAPWPSSTTLTRRTT